MSPERRARVMWADASRASAHNLDDLYQRWALKREANPNSHFEAQVKKPDAHSTKQNIDFSTFDFTSPPSIQHARNWKVIIQNRIEEIDASLTGAKAHNEDGFKMNWVTYQQTKAILTAEKAYLNACRRIVKTYIHEWSQTDLRKISELAEEHGDTTTALLGKVLQIMIRLVSDGIELTESDLALMDVIRDHLNDRGMAFKQESTS